MSVLYLTRLTLSLWRFTINLAWQLLARYHKYRCLNIGCGKARRKFAARKNTGKTDVEALKKVWQSKRKREMMIWNKNQAKISLSPSLLTSPSIMCKILHSKNPLFISNFPKGKTGMEKEWKEKGSDKQTSGFPLWIHTFSFHFGLKMECLFFLLFCQRLLLVFFPLTQL